jgi:octaprenyl-diphosphate synthase
MRGIPPANKVLATAITRIEKKINARLTSKDEFVEAFLQYAAASRGKRLRARLTVLSAAALGRLHSRVEQLATAMELLHQATLVHDDVIDHAAQRRHKSTLNARFGNETAVLVGDLLFAQSMNLLIADMPNDIGKIVAHAATQVCFGEIQELKFFRKKTLQPTQYLEMISNKTASLLSACCEAGAKTAQGTPSQVRALAEYGRAFGMAFQIQDDLLDIVGAKKRVGKPVCMDLKEGRITLPVIYGLQTIRGSGRRIVLQQIQGRVPQPQQLRAVLEDCGALDKCRDLAASYAGKAQRALKLIPESDAKRQLRELVSFAIERDY